jgi:hypothetical protein
MSVRIRLTVPEPRVWWRVDPIQCDSGVDGGPEYTSVVLGTIVASFDGVRGRVNENSVTFNLGNDTSARRAATCPPADVLADCDGFRVGVLG